MCRSWLVNQVTCDAGCMSGINEWSRISQKEEKTGSGNIKTKSIRNVVHQIYHESNLEKTQEGSHWYCEWPSNSQVNWNKPSMHFIKRLGSKPHSTTYQLCELAWVTSALWIYFLVYDKVDSNDQILAFFFLKPLVCCLLLICFIKLLKKFIYLF